MKSHLIETLHSRLGNPPIILFPGIFGSSRGVFQELVENLQKKFPHNLILGLNSLYLSDPSLPIDKFDTVEKQAAYILKKLTRLQKKGYIETELCIMSYSYGGILAYELIRQINQNKAFTVSHFVIIDTYLTNSIDKQLETLKVVISKLCKVLNIDYNESITLINKKKTLQENVEAIFAHLNKIISKNRITKDTEKGLIKSIFANLLALSKYNPDSNLDVSYIYIIKATQEKNRPEKYLGWEPLLKNTLHKVYLVPIKADHFSILSKENAKHIVEHIKNLECKGIIPKVGKKIDSLLVYAYVLYVLLCSKEDQKKELKNILSKICNLEQVKEEAQKCLQFMKKQIKNSTLENLLLIIEKTIKELLQELSEELNKLPSTSINRNMLTKILTPLIQYLHNNLYQHKVEKTLLAIQ